MFNQNSKSQVEKNFFGNYRGLVINNKDPLERGRVKIRIHGLYDDVPEEAIPWALYSDPFMGGQGNLGGVFIPDEGSEVWVFFENGDHMQPVYFAGAPSAVAFPKQMTTSDQPDSRGSISYPSNKAIVTKAGHVIELDDTEGNTRVRVAHKSGTQIIMYDNGDMHERVVGNLTRVVFGDLKEYVKGSKESHSLGTMDIRGAMINLNANAPTFDISDAEQRSVSNAMTLLGSTTTNAVIDEPMEQGQYQELLSQGYPFNTAAPDGNVTPIIVEASPRPVVYVGDDTYGSIDYNMDLGGGFKLKDLSSGCVFPHTIVAQVGLTTDEIINNLKAVAENILKPLREEYGSSFGINSGFRRGSGGSQHNKGMAVDIQFPSFAGQEAKYNEVAEFIMKNLNFDQFILEHGRSLWCHVSFDRNKGDNQRGQLLTYHPRKSPQYQSGITNYMA